jgi:hypothetical protein
MIRHREISTWIGLEILRTMCSTPVNGNSTVLKKDAEFAVHKER